MAMARYASSSPDLDPHTRSTAMTHAASAVAFNSSAAPDASFEPDAATAAAIQAMVDSASVWARELIDSTRGPGDPDRHTFPTLDRPPPVFPDAEEAAWPPSSSDFHLSDDEIDVDHQPLSDDE
jgi:hypothetical protein